MSSLCSSQQSYRKVVCLAESRSDPFTSAILCHWKTKLHICMFLLSVMCICVGVGAYVGEEAVIAPGAGVTGCYELWVPSTTLRSSATAVGALNC